MTIETSILKTYVNLYTLTLYHVYRLFISLLRCRVVNLESSELKCDREAVLRCGALDMAVQSFLDQVPDVSTSSSFNLNYQYKSVICKI